MESETLLRVFDALPDLHIIALESEGSEDPAVRQAKITADYIGRKETFKVSDEGESSTCSECGEEVSGSYELFSAGVKQAYTLSGRDLHAAREHGLSLPDAQPELTQLLLAADAAAHPSAAKLLVDSAPSSSSSVADQPAGAGGGGGVGAAGGVGLRGFKRPLPPPVTLDRENVCPFLLRVFVKLNQPHREEDFVNVSSSGSGSSGSQSAAGSEYSLYTWRDASLRELSDLISRHEPAARQWGARLHFSSVFSGGPGARRFVREFGVLNRAVRSRDDFKTLDQARYQLGDIVAVAIWSADRGPQQQLPFDGRRASAADEQRASAAAADAHGSSGTLGSSDDFRLDDVAQPTAGSSSLSHQHDQQQHASRPSDDRRRR
eukprot:TRINITY_DN10866_c0_g1_i2.p2 TRINITY_DN10866_c0_g1~~TRINITY_DN10866_c0_g1_i2.p2  ORF type:complete len:377 (-),score=142.61 TRINITY_DN10866_c0_g1_i2:14-1144(-)